MEAYTKYESKKWSLQDLEKMHKEMLNEENEKKNAQKAEKQTSTKKKKREKQHNTLRVWAFEDDALWE